MMMVVDDIDSMPPRNRLLMNENPISLPAKYPATIIPVTENRVVTVADPPTFISFLKLNSSPSEKSRKIMPSFAQNSMFDSWITVGKYPKCGPTRKPATM